MTDVKSVRIPAYLVGSCTAVETGHDGVEARYRRCLLQFGHDGAHAFTGKWQIGVDPHAAALAAQKENC